MKRTGLVLIAVWMLVQNVQAQTVGEIFSTTQYINHEVWWNKPFADSSRWSYFSFTRFRVNYETQQKNEFLSYSTLNYDLGKGFGLSTGGFITKHGFSPVVAINYFFANDTWLINLFPSVELKQKPNAEIFAFVQFRPKLNDNWRLFSQLIANSNFNFIRHNFSEQNLRVGLDYRSFQFGLGADFRQLTVKEDITLSTRITNNFGIFIRKEF
jgi:hypothetical protein